MWPRRLTRIVVALTVAAFPAAVFDLVLASHAVSHVYSLQLGVATIVIAALLAAPSLLVALLVGRRRRDGWLAPMLALTGFLPALVLLGSVFKEGPVAGYAVALSQGSWVLLFVSAALLVLFFPEGRLRGRDRWLAWAIAIDALLFIVVGALHPGPYPSPDERSPHVFGTLPHAVAAAIVAVTLPGVLVTLVLTVVSLVRRYRRAGVELRAQMRWLALAAMVLPLTLLAAWAGFVINISDAVVFVGLGLAYAAIPTVIGIAVLRPDLFEVDRVLASTATHAIGTGVVLAIFTSANLAAGLLLPGDSVLAAVAATSLCALLLAPLRARLQRRVDRWLYPARRAALAAIDELNRQTAATQARPEQLEAALQRALGDATVRLGFIAADRPGLVDLAGCPLEAAPITVPIPVEMRVAETKVADDLQTTAYYVASEAIANAVKHSRATRIALHVDARGDDLYVRVEDDGIGGAEQHDGSGLARLADRVGAHGGTLFVSSPRDGGTTVEAILPCAS